MDPFRRATRILMVLALASLALGVWAGLVRIGWTWPPLLSTLPSVHGPILIVGFLGTLIALERAAALRRPWAYASPCLLGIGSVLLLVPPASVGATVAGLGGAGLALAFAVLSRRHKSAPIALMALAALLLVAGMGLWGSGDAISLVVPWWISFLVLVIAGERLELSRLIRISDVSRLAFVAAIAIVLGGLVRTRYDVDAGARLFGVGLLALAAWLLGHDLAWRSIAQPGLPRFMGLALIAGYAWLALGGYWSAVWGFVTAGVAYDAMLHAVFLGFVMSMIFAHAPIIFPAVLGIPVPFRRAFYGPLGLLHASLAVRIAGDLADRADVRQWGGLLNGLAILAFFVATMAAIRSARNDPGAFSGS